MPPKSILVNRSSMSIKLFQNLSFVFLLRNTLVRIKQEKQNIVII